MDAVSAFTRDIIDGTVAATLKEVTPILIDHGYTFVQIARLEQLWQARLDDELSNANAGCGSYASTAAAGRPPAHVASAAIRSAPPRLQSTANIAENSFVKSRFQHGDSLSTTRGTDDGDDSATYDGDAAAGENDNNTKDFLVGRARVSLDSTTTTTSIPARNQEAVSYTHLTLPTIYSV